MTVVNPNSIAGINSITVQTGQALNIHAANGDLIRNITNESGISTYSGINITASGINVSSGVVTATSGFKVGTAATLSANGNATFSGIVTATEFAVGTAVTIGKTNGNATFAGIVTATSFVGDGSGLTGAGPALTGSTNNTVVTVTGANAIQGEAELTFDGAHLQQTITASNEGIKLTAAGNHYPAIFFDANRSAENNGIMWLDGKWNGTTVGALSIEAGDDTTNKDDGKITFYTAAGGSMTRKMAIEQDGNVHIDDGDLVIGTSGHGIDFSAHANDGGMTSELFDDYEEGSFTPTSSNADFSTKTGWYTKVGRLVHVQLKVEGGSNFNGSNAVSVAGLPYTNAATKDVVGTALYYKIAFATGYTDLVSPYIQGGGTTIYFMRQNSGSGSGNYLLADAFNTSASIDVNITYFAAT